MKDEERPKEQLLKKLKELLKRVGVLETSEAGRKRAEEALKESEARYRLLAENAADVIWLRDINLRLTYISPSVTRLRGYSVEEAMTQSLEESLTPASLELAMKAFAEEMNRLMEKNQEEFVLHRTLALEMICKDGSTVWTESAISLLLDPEGRPIGIQGVSRDISSRKKVEEEKEKTYFQLLHAQKMEAIGLLAGGVAHDFNNLLTIIQGLSYKASMALPDDNPAKQDMDEIRSTCFNAGLLTRKLLQASAGQPLQLIPLYLNDVISSIMSMFAKIIGKQYNIISEFADDLWTVNAHVGSIEQIVMNLILNARDAMPDGGTISVKIENYSVGADYCDLRPYARQGNHVRLSVSDTGTGMDNETLARVFEPFFSTKEGRKGNGLGLSTVFGIVKRHKGWIEAESEPGKGSVFTVFFPEILEKPREQSKRPRPFKKYQGQGERILIVEDEDTVRTLSEWMLRENGYAVSTAKSAGEALDIFARDGGDFQMVWTDIILPDMSGIKLSDRILALNPRVQFLFSTGHLENANELLFLKEKGYPLLQKPFELPQLLKTMREVLDGGNEG